MNHLYPTGDNCGCDTSPEDSNFVDCCPYPVPQPWDYDPLALYLIRAYSMAGQPMPVSIYKAWDYVIKALKSGETPEFIWQWGSVIVNGNSVTSPLLAGELAPIVYVAEMPVSWVAQGWVHNPSTGTLTMPTTFDNVNMIFQYRNI